MHVGTHGSCVRPNNRAFVFHSPCADARAVRPYMPLVNKSFFIGLIIKVKVQNSKFKVKVPTCPPRPYCAVKRV